MGIEDAGNGAGRHCSTTESGTVHENLLASVVLLPSLARLHTLHMSPRAVPASAPSRRLRQRPLAGWLPRASFATGCRVHTPPYYCDRRVQGKLRPRNSVGLRPQGLEKGMRLWSYTAEEEGRAELSDQQSPREQSFIDLAISM